MDALDSASRHSRPSSAPNSEQSSHGYQPYRDPMMHDRNAMVSSSLLNPGNSYPPQPSYQSGYPQPATQMMPSADSRKAADEAELSQRQSLPSISEVISGAKPSHYPPPPSNAQQNSSFPSHFSSNPPRSYPEHEKPPGSQPVHSSAYPSRQEALSSYSGSPRQPYSVRPGMPGVSERRLSPGGKHELPHGQLPLPYYPPSPRSGSLQYGNYEAWTYQDALTRLGQSSRTLCNFAEAYLRIASEQHGAHPIPERLPTEQEVNDMIAHADQVKYALEQLRDMVQQSMRSERAREGPKGKGPYDEDQDMTLYGEMKPHYGMATEVKKRRGRAAPPGRCHSCNRIDTPEWRRGPDGARTLCNACGLHYAKLERKRQLEARSIRPKPDDRN